MWCTILVVTQGDFGASNQSTIYGALYGDGDISTNRLEIHFRPPPPEAIVGFEFDPSLADQFRPVPGVWREVPRPLIIRACRHSRQAITATFREATRAEGCDH